MLRRHKAMGTRWALAGSDNELQQTLGGMIGFGGQLLLTGPEIRSALESELAQGHELIPLCPSASCPNFDPAKGCPGHEVREERTVC